MGGFSLKMGAFSERGTLCRSSKRLCSCTSLKKMCSRRWLTTSLPPTMSTSCPNLSLGSLLKVPMQGLGGNHLLRLPNKGGCCPKRKKNHPPPRNNVGSGDRIPLTLQKGVHEELVFGVVSADPASVVGEGSGEPSIRLPLPLTRSDPSLLHTNHEGAVGLLLPPPGPHLLHFLHFLLTHIKSTSSPHPSRHGR